MRLFNYLIFSVFAVSAAAAAQAQDASTLRQAEQRGKALLELDRVAQAALVEAEKTRSFRRDDDVLGWVWEPRGSAYTLTFVGQNSDNEVVGRFRIAMSSSGQPLDELERLERMPVPPRLAAQFHARQRAERVDHPECSTTYDTLVLPGDDGRWHAYLMPRSAFPDVHLLGGTLRIDISADGNAVQQVLPLAADCALLQDSADVPALQVTDAGAAHPNELHVYVAQTLGKPLYVTTTANDGTWLIQNGQVSEVATPE